MASLCDATFEADGSSTGENNCFRRLLNQRKQILENLCVKHRIAAQYYVASMLSIVIAINVWKFINFIRNFIYATYDSHFFTPLLKSWTSREFLALYYGYLGGEIFFQVPGALLIYITSSHKFLTISVVISSILHMSAPLAGNSGTLVVLTLAQKFVEAPLRIAVLSMWKDWAPTGQRTIFVFLSFFISILEFPFSYFVYYVFHLCETKESFYISGACGLIWSLFWFFTASDTPPGDPKFPQNEQLCLQISSVGRKPKLTEVPWKSILTSMPAIALCLISFKIGSSFVILETMNRQQAYRLRPTYHSDTTYYHLVFAIVYAVFLTSGAVLIDVLSRKFPRKIKIRKGILSGAFIVHAILLLGILIPNLKCQVIFYCLSYIIFSTSLAGFITNVLDLSTRYVSILCGFVMTFYFLGQYLCIFYMNTYYDFHARLEAANPFGVILYYEIGFTILVAVIFQIWGSVEEQSWSLCTVSGNDYINFQQYPEQEHEL